MEQFQLATSWLGFFFKPSQQLTVGLQLLAAYLVC